MKEVFAVPREGLVVRDPSSKQPLPAGGAIVPLSGSDGTYWRRRIDCGDVTVGEPAEAKKGKGGKL
jgi:hypothetical protein